MPKRFGALALTCCISACAPFVDVLDVSKVPQSERAAALNVELVPAGSPRPSMMTFIGPVEATSCKHLLTDPPSSRANATEQLKIKTLRMGGDAVIDYSCDSAGTDAHGTNCWNSVACGGTAVKVSRQKD